jgi:catalase (peroxidase I)
MLRALSFGLVALTHGASWDAYTAELLKLNWTAVDDDIRTLLTTPNSTWLADYGNYGPLMIRLGWHCSGSYRQSDGRGGCDGGRIRHNPEANWDDNANLDKARALLEPIKAKYGLGLSYGDLYIRSANVAIASMKGPVLGFCAGRMDDADGSASLNFLGPSTTQAANFPCPVNGACPKESGLGPTTVGLIYVNPEGPLGNGLPVESAPQIRDTFGRMGMTDKETVALIGGGHSFGKAHGACNISGGGGAAPSWTGTCNTYGGVAGQGINTVTSGFEGPWTTTPIMWSNQYFSNLLGHTWTLFVGSGGHKQFQVATGSPLAPEVNDTTGTPSVPISMLVADIALTKDALFNNFVTQFAANKTALEDAFSAAWFKLTTSDMGPRKRCYGSQVPPSQLFQNDLPAPGPLPNYTAVKADIRGMLSSQSRADFAQLAWQCASTYRATDFRGGCNGARIRFAPESGLPANIDLGAAALLSALGPVKAKYTLLSWADLIVLAGHTGVEDLFGFGMPFCGGRTDALDGSGSVGLNPPNWTDPLVNFKERAARMGLTDAEAVILAAVPRKGLTATGVAYFAQVVGTGALTGPDMILRSDPGLKTIAQGYSLTANQGTFQTDFTNAWNKVMNADFFIGWNGLTCPGPVAPMTPPPPSPAPALAPSSASNLQLGLAALLLFLLH